MSDAAPASTFRTKWPKWLLSPGWLFVLVPLLLVTVNCLGGGWIQIKLGISWTWPQFIYGLASVEVCALIYFFGVGRLSPHWRPDAPSPELAAASHPLGPAIKPTAAAPVPATTTAADPSAGPGGQESK